jgi:hypothetical protein
LSMRGGMKARPELPDAAGGEFTFFLDVVVFQEQLHQQKTMVRLKAYRFQDQRHPARS